MTSLHDLRFSPPPNSKSRLRLCIKPCAICIPDTGCCILVFLAHLHERLLTTLQRCKATNLCCIASSLKFLWYGSKECKKILVWNGIWKKILVWNGMEDFWYGMELEWNKIASMEYGKIVFHSIPCPDGIPKIFHVIVLPMLKISFFFKLEWLKNLKDIFEEDYPICGN